MGPVPEGTVSQPITNEDVKHLIHEWGRLHNDHASLSAFLPIIAEEGFEIRFGDVVLKGYAGLEEHQEIKRQFFDESHIYNSIDVKVSDGQAEAKSVVQWEASVRDASAPRSTRIKAVIHHSWLIARSSKTGKPVIVQHVVDSFKYLPGFEPPAPAKPAPHLDLPK
ncbi:MAG: hypothetical protein EPO64_02695 [Nitrospirae bacterium]|nr:MAG: hypothetical protein EPO64_02695 [Nitrospirota bacterium]